METEKRKKFLINVAFWAVIAAIVYFAFKYATGVFMPFIIAFVVASAMRPLARFVSRKLPIKQSVASVICVLLFFLLIGVLLVLLGVRGVNAAGGMFARLPSFYAQTVEPEIRYLFVVLEDWATRYDVSITETLDAVYPQIVSSVGNAVTSISGSAVSYASSFATKVPGFMLKAMITVIASFFIAADYERITAFLMRNLPKNARAVVRDTKSAFIKIVKRYGKSYALIMLIDFIEIFVGMLILGIGRPALIAFLLAVVDIFPVVGTGFVLIPWAIFCLIQRNYFHAIGLFVIYLVVTVVRQTMEPRIVGKHVGLHPLVTLLSMFVGYSLFGVVGIFGLPVTVAIVMSLSDSGSIRSFQFFGDEEDKSQETQAAE